MLEFIKAFFIGIVQGITEWLPVSSTGHMILFDEFFRLNVTDEFREMFFVVIQLGSILAVLVLYFGRLWPFSPSKSPAERRGVWVLWSKILVAALPAGIVGVLFDDFIDSHFFNAWVVAAALIVYGIVFIVLERKFRDKPRESGSAEDITYGTALKIGAFQMLALIPGTSRSGSTIIGAMITGVNRTAAAEFSFFLALPVMAGASLLKIVKFFAGGGVFTGTELGVLAIGTITAFLVSLVAIKFLVGFVRRHSFEAFGWYRIVLGILVLAWFSAKLVF